MSALARHFHLLGHSVRGYDRSASDFTAILESEGIPVFYEDRPDLLGDAELIVYTPAVPQDLALLQEARRRGLLLHKRAEVLGWLTRGALTVAAAGTHGKTTITSMIAQLLRAGKQECTAFLGGVSHNFQGNYVSGRSDLIVVEADEYDRSFLQLSPDVAVITFTEPDHLDVYGGAQSVLEAYQSFAALLPETGTLLVRHADPHKHNLSTRARLLCYGLESDADCRAENLHVGAGFYRFDYVCADFRLSDLELHIGGRHNVENAVAAIAAAIAAGADRSSIAPALRDFRGNRRRFEMLCQTDRLVVIDDYAHHPTELAAVLSAARELFADRRLVVVFQPHLFSRTRDFAQEFAAALQNADLVALLPVYAAREEPLPGVDSWQSIGRHIAGARLLSEDDLIAFAHKLSEEAPTLLLCAGAGSISSLARRAAAEFTKH